MAVYSALELARSGHGKNIVIPAKVCVRESCGCTCKQFSGLIKLKTWDKNLSIKTKKYSISSKNMDGSYDLQKHAYCIAGSREIS